jgi:hypothetical protein
LPAPVRRHRLAGLSQTSRTDGGVGASVDRPARGVIGLDGLTVQPCGAACGAAARKLTEQFRRRGLRITARDFLTIALGLGPICRVCQVLHRGANKGGHAMIVSWVDCQETPAKQRQFERQALAAREWFKKHAERERLKTGGLPLIVAWYAR